MSITYIVTSQNSENGIKNNSTQQSANKNIAINNNTTESGNSTQFNPIKSAFKNSNYEALKAKLIAEKKCLFYDEIAGMPTFKDKDGSWLVPVYDKKTKKFVRSVFVYVNKYKDPIGNYIQYIGGPLSLSEYKKVIRGKTYQKFTGPWYEHHHNCVSLLHVKYPNPTLSNDSQTNDVNIENKSNSNVSYNHSKHSNNSLKTKLEDSLDLNQNY